MKSRSIIAFLYMLHRFEGPAVYLPVGNDKINDRVFFWKTQKTLSLTYSRNLIMHEYLLIFIINIHINKYYLCKN